MKLKTRIIVSFFIIILEPLLFTGMAFWGFSQYQLKAIEKKYGIENATYESLTNTAEVINSMTSGTIGRLAEAARNSPKELEILNIWIPSIRNWNRCTPILLCGKMIR